MKLKQEGNDYAELVANAMNTTDNLFTLSTNNPHRLNKEQGVKGKVGQPGLHSSGKKVNNGQKQRKVKCECTGHGMAITARWRGILGNFMSI